MVRSTRFLSRVTFRKYVLYAFERALVRAFSFVPLPFARELDASTLSVHIQEDPFLAPDLVQLFCFPSFGVLVARSYAKRLMRGRSLCGGCDRRGFSTTSLRRLVDCRLGADPWRNPFRTGDHILGQIIQNLRWKNHAAGKNNLRQAFTCKN